MTSNDISAILAGMYMGYGEVFTTTDAMGKKVKKGKGSSELNTVLELNLTKCTTIDG